MEDGAIIELYWQRSERAIEETRAKYGGYCYQIAFNLLRSPEDAEETVSDTYHADAAGTALNFEVLSEAVSSVRASAPLGRKWKARIAEDYEKRKK